MNTNAVNFSVETAKAESRTDEKFLAMNWAQHLQTPGRHRGLKLFFLPSTPGEKAFLPKTSACHGIAQHPDPYGGLGYSCGKDCTERIKGYTSPSQISIKMSRQPPLLATAHTQEYFCLGEPSPVIPGRDWLPEQKDWVCCSSSLRTDWWRI